MSARSAHEAAGPRDADGAEPEASAGPVIAAISFRDEDEDETTRLNIVQSGFGTLADWSALIDSWRGGLNTLLALAFQRGVLLVRAVTPLPRARAVHALPVVAR